MAGQGAAARGQASRDLDRSRQLTNGSGKYSWKDPGSNGEDWKRECAWHTYAMCGQDVHLRVYMCVCVRVRACACVCVHACMCVDVRTDVFLIHTAPGRVSPKGSFGLLVVIFFPFVVGLKIYMFTHIYPPEGQN